jgi:hypothetical protein
MIPTKDRLTICFAHIAYQMQQRLLALNTGVASSEVRDREALASRGIRLAKRQRGERPRGFRARDRSDSRVEPAVAQSARQSGEARLTWHDW